MIRSIVIDRGSIRYETFTDKFPVCIQLKKVNRNVSSSSGTPIIWKSSPTPITNGMNTSSDERHPENFSLFIFLPKIPLIRNPTSGRSIIRKNKFVIRFYLPF